MQSHCHSTREKQSHCEEGIDLWFRKRDRPIHFFPNGVVLEKRSRDFRVWAKWWRWVR